MIKGIVRFLFLSVVLFWHLPAVSQLKSYHFTQLDSLQNTEKRRVVVFIYTDWCRYCWVMKNTSFQDKKVVQLLNENFWFLTLNGEAEEDIIFKGETYRFRPTGVNAGIHELTERLGTVNGKVSFPVLCILNTDDEVIFQYDQFLSSEELIFLLNEFSID